MVRVQARAAAREISLAVRALRGDVKDVTYSTLVKVKDGVARRGGGLGGLLRSAPREASEWGPGEGSEEASEASKLTRAGAENSDEEELGGSEMRSGA